MMTVQYLLIGIVLVVAVSYGAWRIWQALKTANDPCAGCPGCNLKRECNKK